MKNKLFELRAAKDTYFQEYYIKRDWTESRLLGLTIQYLKRDLDIAYGLVLNFKWSIKEKKNFTKDGKDWISFLIDYEFEHRKYLGLEEGVVTICKRVLSKELATTATIGDIIDRERNNTLLFVKSVVPQAVYRVGCNCCYGNGPDIDISTEWKENGDIEIVGSVNFDFEIEEGCH